jgi:hypothetical protein
MKIAVRPSSPTASSASASFTAARTSATRPKSNSPPPMYREMDMRFWLKKAEAEMREFV